MPGTWLGRIGYRLLHRDTFEMMLVPAIADLQFEVSMREQPRGCPADYWALMRALCGAFCFDVWRDLSALKSDADMIALARGILYDPRWPWHAAAHLGASVKAPPQYMRSQPRQFGDLFELD